MHGPINEISSFRDRFDHLYVFDSKYHINRYEDRITIKLCEIYHATSKITLYIMKLNFFTIYHKCNFYSRSHRARARACIRAQSYFCTYNGINKIVKRSTSIFIFEV